MTPTRADQAEATRQAALTAARRLRARQGHDATSLQAIADEMGVTKANVYYYFRTKAEILEALLAPMADALDRLLDAAERLPHGAERSELMTAGFVDQVVTAHRTLGAVNLGDPALRRDLAIARRLEALCSGVCTCSTATTPPRTRRRASGWPRTLARSYGG